MGAALDRQALGRLVKLCGLFSSHHDGERASAAAKADELLRGCGLRWNDVLAPPISFPPHKPQPEPSNVRSSTFAKASFCLDYCDVLTDWEIKFLRSIASVGARGRALSTKQADVLNELFSKCKNIGDNE